MAMVIRLRQMEIFLLLVVALCGWSVHVTAQSSHEQAEIIAVLASSFDRPESRLAVAPVVVVGDHAVAGWVQDNRGGRALLRKVHGAWTIHLCSGDPLKHADMLENAGVPAAIAKPLAEQLAAAESLLPAATIALFWTFEGVIHIGTDGQHPTVHHGHSGQHK